MHNLTPDEVGRLRRLLARTGLLVGQPIKNGYRGLGLGLDELTAFLPADARVVRWSPLYWDALFPFFVNVHPTPRMSTVTPIIGQHDLRLLVAAHRRYGEHDAVALLEQAAVPRTGVLYVHDQAHSRLRDRESTCDVAMLSFLTAAENEARAFHTFNHPRRFVLGALAAQVHSCLGLEDFADDPRGPEPLGAIRAPVEEPVLRVRGLHGEARQDWIVDGQLRERGELVRAHLAWYAQHQEVVAAGLTEHAERLRQLELVT